MVGRKVQKGMLTYAIFTLSECMQTMDYSRYVSHVGCTLKKGDPLSFPHCYVQCTREWSERLVSHTDAWNGDGVEQFWP